MRKRKNPGDHDEYRQLSLMSPALDVEEEEEREREEEEERAEEDPLTILTLGRPGEDTFIASPPQPLYQQMLQSHSPLNYFQLVSSVAREENTSSEEEPIAPPPPPLPTAYTCPLENHLVYSQEHVSSAAAPTAAPVISEDAAPRVGRPRRNPTQAPREEKSGTISPPFEWATNRRARVHSLDYLLSNQILKIKGEVQCKRCEKQFEIEYDLQEKFREIGTFIAENKSSFHDRALEVWKNPVLPKCRYCDQDKSAKPVIAKKKKEINWLFLFLGQMLGCCTIEQLKYFCKHTGCHRTGAKDRVLYSAYLGICKQLEPNGPFNG